MKHLKLSLLFLLCVLMAVPVSAKRKTKVIAHRGYWKTEGSAQNSIRSLERANEIKVYGSEFDVHLTADNVPVVYHDRKIEGKGYPDGLLCGAERPETFERRNASDVGTVFGQGEEAEKDQADFRIEIPCDSPAGSGSGKDCSRHGEW